MLHRNNLEVANMIGFVGCEGGVPPPRQKARFVRMSDNESETEEDLSIKGDNPDELKPLDEGVAVWCSNCGRKVDDLENLKLDGEGNIDGCPGCGAAQYLQLTRFEN